MLSIAETVGKYLHYAIEVKRVYYYQHSATCFDAHCANFRNGEISAEESVDNNTGSRRNSELIINKYNILLIVINDNLIT